MSQKDFYQILGVQRNASQADIKIAFRENAKVVHPDRRDADTSEESARARFQELAEAYGVLKDPIQRTEYDRLGDQRYRSQMRGEPSIRADWFSEIFKELWGTAGGWTPGDWAWAEPKKEEGYILFPQNDIGASVRINSSL